MKERTKISVAVITYNQESTIRQTLDSILVQKGDFDLEIIIGEDCSTDATHAICEEYARQWNDGMSRDKSLNEPLSLNDGRRVVRLLPNTHNLGIMGNFARVMKACTGEYVGICAGDDYWCDEQKLQKQLTYMKANPQFGVCCTSGYRLMVETGRMVPGIEPLNPILSGDVSQFYRDNLSGVYAQPLSLLIRSDMLKFVDFDEFVRRKFPFEDYPMQSILAHHTLFGYLPDRTSVYRISSKSATFTSFDSPKYMAYFAGIADMRRYLHSLFPEDVPFSEEWATEYVQHKQFLQYAWYGNFNEAKTLVHQMDDVSDLKKKLSKIVSNRLFFYCFTAYKRYLRFRNYRRRTY